LQQYTYLFALLLCVLPFSYAPCEITGNQETNVGIGVYIDQSGYCFPGQTFIAKSKFLYDAEFLIGPGASWYIEAFDGTTSLGKSSYGSYAGYNIFSRVKFIPPIATVPGKTYFLRPRGSGGNTWYINNNNMYPDGKMRGDASVNDCWGATWDSAFHVNCDPNPPPITSFWKCYPGIDVPLRENTNGDVECMALDDTNCLWSDNCANVLAQYSTEAAAATLNPLACGQEHLTKHGGPGYNSAAHWCYKGWEFMKPWYCLPELTSPMKINAMGNPECLSVNGRDCLWGTTSCTEKQVYDASTVTPIIPLACGAGHMSAHGSIGYDNPVHWCNTVIKQLEPNCYTNGYVSFCQGTCTGNIPCPLINS